MLNFENYENAKKGASIMKKITGFIAALLSLCLLCTGVFAAEAGGTAVGENVSVPFQAITPDPDSGEEMSSHDLFSVYLAAQLYGGAFGGANTFSATDSAGSRLEGREAKLYNCLKDYITNVAANGGSSTFTCTAEKLGIDLTEYTWTQAQLDELEGVMYDAEGKEVEWKGIKLEDLYIGRETGTIPPESMGVYLDAWAKFYSQDKFYIDYDAVLSALMADLPYELYWFDKTMGALPSIDGGYSAKSDDKHIELERCNYVISFSVSKDYQAEAYDPEKPAVTGKVAAVEEAVTNAANIIKANENKSDYEKLCAYKDAICALTSYNDAAADDNSHTPYGDPWQLIYVFDDNENNQVVCEGYAKAFQYLCDIGGLSDKTHCYTVEGYMSGGTGAGPHMWNIVRIGERNYLVDITNSDQGSIGENGELFLAGSGKKSDSLDPGDGGYAYDFIIPQDKTSATVSYAYAQNQSSVWGKDENTPLNLSETSYSESFDPTSVTTGPWNFYNKTLTKAPWYEWSGFSVTAKSAGGNFIRVSLRAREVEKHFQSTDQTPEGYWLYPAFPLFDGEGAQVKVESLNGYFASYEEANTELTAGKAAWIEVNLNGKTETLNGHNYYLMQVDTEPGVMAGKHCYLRITTAPQDGTASSVVYELDFSDVTLKDVHMKPFFSDVKISGGIVIDYKDGTSLKVPLTLNNTGKRGSVNVMSALYDAEGRMLGFCSPSPLEVNEGNNEFTEENKNSVFLSFPKISKGESSRAKVFLTEDQTQNPMAVLPTITIGT